MESNCFCHNILHSWFKLPNVVRDLALTQSWNLGIQRFLVSRYFGCTDQSWADPEQVFKVLPGKQRHSHFLHPCFWSFQCYLQPLGIYLSWSSQKYRASTEQCSWYETLIYQNPACVMWAALRFSSQSVVVHLHFGRVPEEAGHRPTAPGMSTRGILCTNKVAPHFPATLTRTGYPICCQN